MGKWHGSARKANRRQRHRSEADDVIELPDFRWSRDMTMHHGTATNRLRTIRAYIQSQSNSGDEKNAHYLDEKQRRNGTRDEPDDSVATLLICRYSSLVRVLAFLLLLLLLLILRVPLSSTKSYLLVDCPTSNDVVSLCC